VPDVGIIEAIVNHSRTSDSINSGTQALISLSSAWGIGLTVFMVIILGAIAIIIIYLWKVAPISAAKRIEQLKSQVLIQQHDATEISLKQANPAPIDYGPKFKTIFAQLDAIKVRLESVEKTCPKHQTAINEVVSKMQVINETLPQALDSITSLSDRVWDIALRGKQGEKG
jgi:hypothetical protein